jgi:predicted metal-dependent HD superfamily phosphohydrolase
VAKASPKPGRYGIEDVYAWTWLKPAYWRTLQRLRPARPDVAHESGALRFGNYPFEPASVFPAGAVEADQVREVILAHASEVRLKSGDILFVTGAGKAALLAFIHRTGVHVATRRSVWSALLDPFLDSWEEQPVIDRQFEWLASLGLDRAAVERWRREVAVPMIAYNFGARVWEWSILTLYEVLVAQRASLERAAFADFYARALALAALDPAAPAYRPSTPSSIAAALHDVLLDWYPRKRTTRAFSKEWEARSADINALTGRLGGELTGAYSQPHRSYHNVAHIERCLHELAGLWNYAVDLAAVRWALLFHDAVHDPQREDNEARSADWACRVMIELGRPAEEQARVRDMILATAHSRAPRSPDEALVLDIDLSILGADADAFDDYERSVRQEYATVPEDAYRRGRAALLESFLQRPQLYNTAPLRSRYEKAARTNLERSLSSLRMRAI